MHNPKTGQELETGSRVGRMFPVNNLYLSLIVPVSDTVVATTVFSLPSLALWHSHLGHVPSSQVQ